MRRPLRLSPAIITSAQLSAGYAPALLALHDVTAYAVFYLCNGAHGRRCHKTVCHKFQVSIQNMMIERRQCEAFSDHTWPWIKMTCMLRLHHRSLPPTAQHTLDCSTYTPFSPRCSLFMLTNRPTCISCPEEFAYDVFLEDFRQDRLLHADSRGIKGL